MKKEEQRKKIVAIGDTHGNYVAFEQAVAYAIENNATGFIFTGDYGTDFLQMHECLALIQKIQSLYPTWVIKGNREDYLINYEKSDKTGWKYNTTSGVLLETYKSITKEDMEYITNLPSNLVVRYEDMEPIFVIHNPATLTEENLKYILDNNIHHVLGGHIHIAQIVKMKHFTIENCGSMGLTDNGITNSGTIGIFEEDPTTKTWKYENKVISYDAQKNIDLINQNRTLCEECDHWDELLKLSMQTGCMLTVDYVLELQRLYAIYENNQDVNLTEDYSPISYGLLRDVEKQGNLKGAAPYPLLNSGNINEVFDAEKYQFVSASINKMGVNNDKMPQALREKAFENVRTYAKEILEMTEAEKSRK